VPAGAAGWAGSWALGVSGAGAWVSWASAGPIRGASSGIAPARMAVMAAPVIRAARRVVFGIVLSVPGFEISMGADCRLRLWPGGLAAAREGRHHAEQAPVAQGKIP